ncbi:MAG: L-histidine N(alpha)-methyltransferase [Rubrivivax sp.]
MTGIPATSAGMSADTSAAPARVPRFVQLYRHDDARLKAELQAGLAAIPAQVSPKFLYDALGSRLFDAITELPEYYPTRTEALIMQRCSGELAAALGTVNTLVDLGAGNCAKAGRLFVVLRPRRYVAVDISVDFLRQSVLCLQREHPQVDMLGVGSDFSEQLVLPPEAGDGPRTVFYPGSSIGNFTPSLAVQFLRQVHTQCAGGQLLIGVDLVKPDEWLVPAYDDALGVTAAFNLNILRHINALLGCRFDLRQWRHVALFNRQHSRIEMHLEARTAQRVDWDGGHRDFAPGERIHTENSYKYEPADFEALLREAGFSSVQRWTDDRRWFGVFVAQA